MNGLPDEFDALKTTIRARSDDITMEELSSLLCSESIHIESKHKKVIAHEFSVAYAATRGSNNSFSPSSSRGRSSFRGNRGGYRGNGSKGGKFFSRGKGRFIQGGFSLTCQICGKGNHSALDYWYRLDTTYPQSQQSSHQSSQSSSGFSTPKAYVASTPSIGSYDSSPWYLDSATWNYMNNDLSHLSLHRPYQGPDQVTAGNGNSLPILHTGKGEQARDQA